MPVTLSSMIRTQVFPEPGRLVRSTLPLRGRLSSLQEQGRYGAIPSGLKFSFSIVIWRQRSAFSLSLGDSQALQKEPHASFLGHSTAVLPCAGGRFCRTDIRLLGVIPGLDSMGAGRGWILEVLFTALEFL